jgi:hypothetical protein
MSDAATQYVYKLKDVVTMMLKHQDIHEGHWQIMVNFGFGASNVGPNESDLSPAAIVPVLGIGIQKLAEKTPLSVDAAEVNPA